MDYYIMGISILFHLRIFVTKLSKKINIYHLSVGTCFRIYGTFYSAIHFIFLLLLNTSNTFDL
ncbi:hypothetical protein F6X77_11590 [Enterococcus faecium]|nr:hypothetical protein F6X76_11910 [Enterococcus faecium]KAA9137809.1 hypothetical protein F6X73_11650 [Enterococcus faecium]KAA9142414.1 hypothetical protein F6X77_11590 [Enterococcus faecium]KAA9167752.1 hypothetical protein F6X80_10525 [Enterococcus faecium]KAA9168914.1 hypothetical protein F6X81_10620 [Enterococcus faecium]